MKIFKFLPILSQISADERPNIILILADDFGVGDFQVNQASAPVPTPNIDRLGTEGINFKDAHSGSSRCGPSRYMLMTGRYSMSDSKKRNIEVDREPHLGSILKKAGYTTSAFGKTQPLRTLIREDDNEQAQERLAKLREYFDNLTIPGDFNASRDVKKLFVQPGNYSHVVSELDHYYDYAFTSYSPCCQPNGYYENGQQTEPFSKWAIPRKYPEFGETMGTPCAYVAAPWFEEETFAEKRYTANFPLSMIAQASYDSRTEEQTIAGKLTDFIREQEHSDVPFFSYYGIRTGHGPFNTPERFRNTTSAGVLGEMIAETDEIVGNIFRALEETNQIDNTLIVFMNDNGAGTNYEPQNEAKYGWKQNAIDLGDKKSVRLRGGKGYQYEGGTRNPFMWWYPKAFPARTIEHKTVSYLDVFRTLADLVDYKPSCNEGPDSRSLLYLLSGRSEWIPGPEEVLTHAIKGNSPTAIRWNKWKLIPGSQEFFDMEKDPSEENNLWDKPWAGVHIEKLQGILDSRLESINEREETTNFGQLEIC